VAGEKTEEAGQRMQRSDQKGFPRPVDGASNDDSKWLEMDMWLAGGAGLGRSQKRS
jgi:hypothetical protein